METESKSWGEGRLSTASLNFQCKPKYCSPGLTLNQVQGIAWEIPLHMLKPLTHGTLTPPSPTLCTFLLPGVKSWASPIVLCLLQLGKSCLGQTWCHCPHESLLGHLEEGSSACSDLTVVSSDSYLCSCLISLRLEPGCYHRKMAETGDRTSWRNWMLPDALVTVIWPDSLIYYPRPFRAVLFSNREESWAEETYGSYISSHI